MDECNCEECLSLRTKIKEMQEKNAEIRQEIEQIKTMMTPDELDRLETIMILVREMDGD